MPRRLLIWPHRRAPALIAAACPHSSCRCRERADVRRLLAGLAAIATLPTCLSAQRVELSGRVFDPAADDSGVQNAVVVLEGRGAQLSDRNGDFRFRGIPVGAYTLRVTAPGYEELRLRVSLVRDTALAVALRPDPIAIAGVGVVLGRRMEVNGQVRDPATNSWVSRAEVLSDQGHTEYTNLFGRFDLDDVFDGPLLRITINAFRYLPLDTTFVPDRDERYAFDLLPDPVMARMVENFLARLDDRRPARNYWYEPTLNRDDLARMKPSTSLREVLEREFPPTKGRRIVCLLVDEWMYNFMGDEGYRRSVYDGTFVNDVERVELLEFGPGYMMARVYTRAYFLEHVGSSAKLAVPSLIVTPSGVFCT